MCAYTAFRTRSLDEIFRNICGFAIILPNRFFRYEHCDNHAYTQLHGKDPELIELPVLLGTYLSFVSSVPFWGFRLLEFGRHIICRFSAAEMKFIPREDRVSVVVEARVTAMAYAAILALSAVFDFWAVLWYWLSPLFMGEPVMRAIGMTENVGLPNSRDMKVNTRTNLVSNPMRFLCWNMNYHAEHHYASSVPFHALPELHRKLQGCVHVEERGYLRAHIDIFAQIRGRKPRLGTRAVDQA